MTALEARPAGTPAARADAEQRADRIRAAIVTIAAWQVDVITAHRERDWIALGYGSWGEYLDGEYGEARVPVSREQRREIVADMRQAGMSTRAIGSALGESHQTIGRDAAGGPSGPAGPVTGTDGKTYRPRPRRPEPGIADAGPVEGERTIAERVADTEQWWAEQADRLTADGTVDRWTTERPYGLAVVGLSHAAEQITGTGQDPRDLGRHIPAITRGDVDGIRAAHRWLGDFLAAADETEPTS